MDSLVVNEKGIKFSYVDNGAPKDGPYFTIIAVHGMGFTWATFKKVMALASKDNIRFISIVWRGYQGSTPYSESDMAIVNGDDEDKKAAFVNACGLELATLIDKLIQKLNLPPITTDGKAGGVGLIGWSAGCTWTLSAISNMTRLPSDSQKRLGAHVRAYTMHEPPSMCLGLPLPPKIWSPLIDTSLPQETRKPFYMSWITSYFDHGDLFKRDIDAINYWVPSIRHAPTIYNISSEEKEEVVDDGQVDVDMVLIWSLQRASHLAYNKACFDPSIGEVLPQMKITVLNGDATASFSLNGTFSIQDDEDKNKRGIRFEFIPDANHFVMWDEPEKTLKAYVAALL